MRILFSLLLFCFVFQERCFSQNNETIQLTRQDSLYKSNYHVVGCGVQFLRDTYYLYGHNKSSITYNQPSINILYRYFFPWKLGKSITSANVNINYRTATGYSESGGLGGSSIYKGSFNVYRFDVGLSRLRTLGAKKGFYIGGGFALGGLIYSSGNLISTDYSGNKIVTNPDISISKSELLSKVNVNVNFEMSTRFKLTAKSFLLVGSKFQIESPEGFNARIGIAETLFLAYMFK